MNRRTQVLIIAGAAAHLLLQGCDPLIGDAFTPCRAPDFEQGGCVPPPIELCPPGGVGARWKGIEGDVLTLEKDYFGGCQERSYRLCTDGAFYGDDGGELDLWLVDTNPRSAFDNCDGVVTVEPVFDLSPIREWYEDAYGEATGEVTLHLRGPETLRYMF